MRFVYVRCAAVARFISMRRQAPIDDTYTENKNKIYTYKHIHIVIPIDNQSKNINSNSERNLLGMWHDWCAKLCDRHLLPSISSRLVFIFIYSIAYLTAGTRFIIRFYCIARGSHWLLFYYGVLCGRMCVQIVKLHWGKEKHKKKIKYKIRGLDAILICDFYGWFYVFTFLTATMTTTTAYWRVERTLKCISYTKYM